MDVAVPSLLGQNLAERLRSTSLALIGVVGAAALAMVGLTLQHGVALVSSGPIHEPAREPGVSPARSLGDGAATPLRSRVVAGQAVERAPAESSSPGLRSEPAGPAPAPSAPAASPPGVGAPRAERGGGRAPRQGPLPEAPAKPSPAAAPPPAAAPVKEPVAVPSGEPPQPVPPPPAAVPGKGHAYGKSGGTGPEGTGPPGLAGK